MATTSVLETLDKIAKDSLANADRNMRALELDQAIRELSRADAAVYIMARASESNLEDFETTRDLREASRACLKDLSSLGWESGVIKAVHAEHSQFYESRGYNLSGLFWDHWTIKNYIKLIENTKAGNCAVAEAIDECLMEDITFGLGFYNGWRYLPRGSLQRRSGPFEVPKLLSEESLRTVLDYAKRKEAQNILDNLSLTQKMRKTLFERITYPFPW